MKRLLVAVALVAAAFVALPLSASAEKPFTAVYPIDTHDTICGGAVTRDGVGEARFRGYDRLPGVDVWREGEWNFHATWTYTNPSTNVSISGQNVGLEHYKTDGVLDASGYLHYVTQSNGNVLSLNVPGQKPIVFLKGRIVSTYVVNPVTGNQIGDRTMISVNGIYQEMDEFNAQICEYLVP